MDKGLIKIKRHYIFNKFILIWIVFGLVVHIYALLDLVINDKSLQDYTVRDFLKYIIVFTILVLYVFAYSKVKRELKKSDKTA